MRAAAALARLWLAAALPTLAAAPLDLAYGQGAAAGPRPFRIVAADPAIFDLVDPDAELELVGDRFGLTEGPVWVPDGDGYLLFSDLISNVIYKWTPSGELSVFLERSGYSGDDLTHAGYQTRRGRMAVLLIGPNGLTLDSQGRLIFCATPDRAVLRLERDGSRTVLADRWDGKRFSGPNDLALRSDGALYFTDSVFGLRDGASNPATEIPFSGIYVVKDGMTRLLYSNSDNPGGWPNGLTFSPDERFLYLNAGFQNILRYDVLPDGSIANGTVFIPGEGSDGMKVDERGNLYTTSGAGPGEVRITAPDGTRLGVLALPIAGGEPQTQICATNVAFGDADGRALYITACEHVYRLRLKVPGVRPAPAQIAMPR
jgi:gluconolactonase